MNRRSIFTSMFAFLVGLFIAKPAVSSLLIKGELIMKPIRLWRLGTHDMPPTQEQVELFQRAILLARENDGPFDIIWTADVDVTVVNGFDDKILVPEILPDGRKRLVFNE